jgi:hypothetical protein
MLTTERSRVRPPRPGCGIRRGLRGSPQGSAPLATTPKVGRTAGVGGSRIRDAGSARGGGRPRGGRKEIDVCPYG